ncbi:MAG: cysteine methyltransferase [Acidobacteria bacterium]|nr:MAG: cysteine methyltransferase [Acidobacteriota bacterium]
MTAATDEHGPDGSATDAMSPMVLVDELPSPIGPLTLTVRDGRVCLLHFGPRDSYVDRALARWYPGVAAAAGTAPHVREMLDSYFDGNIAALDRIDVEFNGTPFQRRVWDALRSIEAGATTSYAALAHVVGAPRAVRAVGAANGANPVAVIVPCHRVIGQEVAARARGAAFRAVSLGPRFSVLGPRSWI